MRAAVLALLLALFPLVSQAQVNSTEANGIRFFNSGSEQMRLSSGGWLGLGVTSPSMKFEVRDNLNGTVGTQLYNTSTGAAAQTRLNISSGSPNAYLSLFSTENTGNPYGMLTFATGLNAGYISTEKNAPLIFRTSATEQMRIAGNGWVGIGTTSPSYNFDLRGNMLVSSTGSAYFFADRTAGGVSALYRQGGISRLWDSTAGDVLVYNSAASVGIRTNSPQMALDVSSTDNMAIRGITSAATHAIWGQSLNAGQGGVAGVTANGTYYGILGYANAYALHGSGRIYTVNNNSSEAIYGYNSSSGVGVRGFSSTNYGLYGESGATYGIYGRSTLAGSGGVLGYAQNNSQFGILGYANQYSFYGSGEIYNNGNVRLNVPGGNAYYFACFDGSLYMYYGTTGCGSSDRRLKDNIATLENSLDKVVRLRGTSYTWKDSKRGEGPQVGMIAQEVEEVYPQLVSTDSRGIKSVDYSHMVAPLIEAIKTLKAQNDSLKAENQQVWQAIKALEAKVSTRP